MGADLKKILINRGATVVGFAAIEEALAEDIAHLNRAISIGVDRKLNEDTISSLSELQEVARNYLRKRDYRFLLIPPDSDRITDSFISRIYNLFSHKVAATCAGIGWVGRNGLLISPEYGPRLSFATVLTDAPLEPDKPIEECLCGGCNLCVDLCPSDALLGEDWSRSDPYPELIDLEKCKTYKDNSRAVSGKPNCGFCINICPFGRKQPENALNNTAVYVEDAE